VPVDLSVLEREAEDTCMVLRAVANPHRLLILCCLSKREHSVKELEQKIDLGQSALSQHLARLRRDNLVATRRDAQTIYYSIGNARTVGLLEALSTAMCNEAKA
jgi:DNA-binding transcriptional ArsR family regulator